MHTEKALKEMAQEWLDHEAVGFDKTEGLSTYENKELLDLIWDVYKIGHINGRIDSTQKNIEIIERHAKAFGIKISIEKNGE